MTELCARWAELDERYRADAPVTEDVRVAVHGAVGLVFSAPHSVRHRRRGAEKAADIRTGGLAELLAEVTGGTAVTSLGRLAADPNWDSDPTPFRRRLLSVIPAGAMVLDLHGMGDGWGVDAVIGLGPAPTVRVRSAAGALHAALAARGLEVRVGHPFPAIHPGTVTAAIQAAGGEALQLELTARRRRPLRDPEASGLAVRALLDWAEASPSRPAGRLGP